MFKLIEKLREKSDRTKKQIAFLLSLFFAGIIFIIWLSVIYPDFRQNQAKEDNVAKLEPSPISNFTDAISSSFQSIVGEFGAIKDSVASFSSVPIHYSATTTENNL